MILKDFTNCKPKEKLYVVSNYNIRKYYFACFNPTEKEKPELTAVCINGSNTGESTVLSLKFKTFFITNEYEEAKFELLRQCEDRVSSIKKIYLENDEKLLLKYKMTNLIKNDAKS